MQQFSQVRFTLAIVWAAICLSGCSEHAPEISSHPEKTSHPEGNSAGKRQAITSVKLARREAVENSPRFQMLGAERTGLDWVHRWDPPKGFESQLDSSVAGGGICLGDYDGDGLTDLFLTRPQGGNRLYRNLGDFRFKDVTRHAGLVDREFWGTGASFGDIDNDGDLDLVVCGYHAPNHFYMNQGDGTFKDQAGEFGIDFSGASVMMALADYDRDGDLDAYLLTNRHNASDREAALVKNFNLVQVNGQWTVQKEVRDLVGISPLPDGLINLPQKGNRLNLGYDDRFTLPDGGEAVLILTGQRDRLYRNNLVESGTTSFTDVTDSTLEGASSAHDCGLSATWWDYNSDGLPDLYVANDFKGPDHLYRNHGDGTFSDVIQEVLPHTPWYSMGSDTADINNDGLPDLMGSDMQGTSHYTRKLMMGNMGRSAWFLEAANPQQYMRNAVYLNSGVDRFMEAAQMTGVSDTGWTWALKFGDLDNDGDEDLYVSNGMTREWFNSDLKNQSQKILDQGGQQPMDAFWRDQPQQREPNIAFENSGDLKFSSRGKAWGLDYEGVSFGAALGDLDQDGDLDLVVNNFEEPASVYRNGSTEGHQVKIRLQGVRSNQFGIGATVRIWSAAGQQMRYLTLSRGFMSANDPTIHFGLGADKVIKELTVEWPSGQVQKFENLDADHLYTITEPDGALPKQPREPQSTMFAASEVLSELQHEEKSFNDFERQPLLPQKLSQLGPGLAWGDIDSDGDDDLYVGGASGQPGRVVVCDGQGEFESVGRQSYVFYQDKDSEDMGSLLFDVDSDGDLDLYVVSGSVECDPGADVLRDRLYLNDGGGSFSDEFEMRPAKKNKVETDVAEGLDNDPDLPQGPLPDLRDSGSIVTAADFDQDGDLDLFVGGRSIPGKYPETPQSRLLRNDWSTHGGFTDVTDQLAPGLRKTGMVTSAIWSDADGDGDPDLLVTHDWGPVKLWKNNEGQLVDRTQEAQLSERLGWFNGIAARDLDNDGDIDYVVTNFGLNTKYHATADNPVLVYHGDFDGQGRKCLVEAHYEHDTLYPIRGKSCSTNAMPFVSEKLPSFKEFALASLSDIYTEEGLTQSKRFEVNALESGVLINDGEARFHFKPLPRLAQLSPGFGVVLTEVDGDGNADMYLVQNFYSPQQETGRMDGGVSLLLKGKGDGTFHPVWPDQSGLVVPGDAKGLTATDLNGDGWVDFVVSINDGELLAFENRGCQDGRMFNVRLRGRPGNLAAVGARVRVEREDGTNQTAEVYAGSGYLSQSSSTLVFGLGQTGQVKRVEVRWPDGMVTSHPPEESAPMIIDHP